MATVVFNTLPLATLLRGPMGPVGRDLGRRAVRVESKAKQHVRVDKGRLRSSITWHLQEDALGVYVDIGSNVEYAIFQEGFKRAGGGLVPRASTPKQGGYTPYLRPGLLAAAGP